MSDLPVLGIDLGTTYSCVARLDELKPVVLRNFENEETTPSVVYFENEDNVVVGKGAKNELGRNPKRVVQHIKRHMGVDGYSIEIDDRAYYPPQVSAIILESIVADARRDLGLDVPEDGPLADVVITVPAYFGGAERAATKSAGEMARLNVLGIINEPTAAAIAHGLTSGEEKRTILVYDLGGGTFDVTVVEASSELIRAVATGGDRELGGADWDDRIRSWVLDRFRDEHPGADDPEDDTEAIGELKIAIEDRKKDLSKKQKEKINLTANTVRGSFELSRDEFEEITADLVDRTLQETDRVLDAAKDKGVTGLDEVIMVGGMSRMPVLQRRLQERLEQRFGSAPNPRVTDPDLIVAKGAALFAVSAKVAEHYGDDSSAPERLLPGSVPAAPEIRNITSRGYGVKAVRDERDEVGYVSWLIKPNDELPTAPQEQYFTVHSNQTEVDIEVFESATNVLNDDVAVNSKLIAGTLKGLPPKQPPRQPIDVTFRLGDDGILEILALGPSGQRLSLEYRLPGAVPDEELAKPLPSIAKY